MSKNKIVKIALQSYDAKTDTWRTIYPKTSGDMLVGIVNNSKQLDGHGADYYMTAKHDIPLRLVDNADKPQGISCAKLLISDDYDADEHLCNNNQLYVKGTGYIKGGMEIATKHDIDIAIAKILESIGKNKVNTTDKVEEQSAVPASGAETKNNK